MYPPQGNAAGVDVSDADAAVGDVKSPKTFYSVAAPRKTGTMPTKAIVAGAETYEEGYHAGNVGGLSAIDTDLAVGNIKKDVNIFGKVGTYEPALSLTKMLDTTIIDESLPDNWIDISVAQVPAAATHVIMTLSGSGYLAKYGKTRGIYNGVERVAEFNLTATNYGVNHVWGGVGVGSAADAGQQGKRYDSDDYKARFSVTVWYLSP